MCEKKIICLMKYVILFKYRPNFFAPLYSSLTLSGTYYYYFSVTVDNCLARLWFIDKNQQNSTYVISNIAKIYISFCFTHKNASLNGVFIVIPLMCPLKNIIS